MTVTINPKAYMIAASIVGKESDVLDTVADQVLLRVRAEAAKHRDTGSYMDSLGIWIAEDRNGKDRLVGSSHPAAVPIEFGHWQRIKRGRRVSAKFIPGLHIMGNAYASIRRVRL